MAVSVVRPTFEDVQWLADRSGGEGQVVSCYADLSVGAGVRSLWREHLRNEVKRIDEMLAGDEVARSAFHRNVEAVESLLSSPHAVQARGIAAFAAVQRGIVHGYALSVPMPNRIVVDEEPYLVPLLEMLSRQRRYLVVHTDTHRGRLYTAVPGAVHPIEAISENVPKHHRASGELWGKQQATIDRHREDHVLHYLDELAREVERAWPEERYDGIVLLGEHEVLEQLRTRLPERLANRIVREAPHAFVGRQVSLGAKVDEVHADAVRAHDARVLNEVKSRLVEHHRIASGAQEVVDALRSGQVGYPGNVVMEPDRGEAAWRCRACGAIVLEATEQCSTCQGRCERTNLWQAIVLLASRLHVPVHVVTAGMGLEKHGGVVALLPRGEPLGPSQAAPAYAGRHA